MKNDFDLNSLDNAFAAQALMLAGCKGKRLLAFVSRLKNRMGE